MLNIIPLWMKAAAVAFVLSVVIGGFFAWRAHERAIGAAAVEAADAKALAEREKKDADLNRRLLEGRDLYIRELESSAGGQVRTVYATPKSDGCGVVTDDAVNWLYGRPAFRGSGPQSGP